MDRIVYCCALHLHPESNQEPYGSHSSPESSKMYGLGGGGGNMACAFGDDPRRLSKCAVIESSSPSSVPI